MSSKKVPESVKPSQAQNEPKPEPEKKRKSPPVVTSQTTTTTTSSVTKVAQVSTTVSSSQQSSQIPSVRNDSSSPPNQNTLAMSVANVIAERILTPSPPVHNDARTVQNYTVFQTYRYRSISPVRYWFGRSSGAGPHGYLKMG